MSEEPKGAPSRGRRVTSASELAAAQGAPVEVKEGLATVVFPSKNAVFYNKVQVLNRDLSVLMLRIYVARRRAELAEAQRAEDEKHRKAAEKAAAEGRPGPPGARQLRWKGLRVLEALAASGLRSIRYWKEVPAAPDDLETLVVNDLDAAAVEAIRRNVLHNGLDPERVRPHHGDANLTMHAALGPGGGGAFDAVDLDPYGTAAPFLDAAVQAVSGSGGLLLVTCTDKSVLCGNNPEVCVAKYGSTALRGPSCHEMALRIVLASLSAAAGRYGRYIVPVASFSINFYVRVFVRVYTSAQEVKRAASKLAHVYQCVGCGVQHLQPLNTVTVNGPSVRFTAPRGPPVDRLCAECGSPHRIGGPVWAAPMHDPAWLADALAQAQAEPQRFASHKQLVALLTLAAGELPDAPLVQGLSTTASLFRSTCPKAAVLRSALVNAGYRVSLSHTDAGVVKTDAPPAAMINVMRCYVRDVAPLARPPEEGSLTARLLARPPAFQADFTVRPEALLSSAAPRFLPNPEENWGPKARAGRWLDPELAAAAPEDALAAKRKANQGKRASKRARVERQPRGDGGTGPAASSAAAAAAAAAAADADADDAASSDGDEEGDDHERDAEGDEHEDQEA